MKAIILFFCLAVPASAAQPVRPEAIPEGPQDAAASAAQTPLRFPDGEIIAVDVADTPAAREKGLMYRKSLPKDYGMLFVFPQEGGMPFWMKNTWVSLDIVFIGADKKVTVIHPRVKPSTKATREEEIARVWGLGQYVLELPAGYAKKRGLKKGDALSFEADITLR